MKNVPREIRADKPCDPHHFAKDRHATRLGMQELTMWLPVAGDVSSWICQYFPRNASQ